MFCVYMHTNRVNGKRYIGWSSKTMQERWDEHVMFATQFDSKLLFHCAIRKYGPQSFEHETLVEVQTREQAKEQEELLVEFYRTFAYDDVGWGYNGTRGGDGATGYKHTPETLAQMSESQKGEKNHMFGKVTSDETKKKLSDKLKGRVFTEEHVANIKKGVANRPPITEEQKRKISEKLTGSKNSPEARAAISASNRERWALKKEANTHICPICKMPRTLRGRNPSSWHVSCAKRKGIPPEVTGV